MQDSNQPAYDNDQIVPVAEPFENFRFDLLHASELERIGRDLDELDGETRRLVFEVASVALSKLRLWLDREGRGSDHGTMIRAKAFCWLFDRDMANINQRELADALGVKKQRVGKILQEFSEQFGFLSTHFYSPEARKAAQAREARKRHDN